MKAVVIGSGFGGLAAAVRLQARGIQTTILEKLDAPGGRAYVYKKDGFTFDCGPTVVTAPYIFEDIFKAANRKLSDYVNLVSLDPFYRIYFHDGTHFDYTGNSERQEREIARHAPQDVEGYRQFMAGSKKIFEKGLIELGDQPFLKLWDMIRVAPDLLKLDAIRSVYSYASKFFTNEKLRRVFSFHPLLVGGSPFRAPAIYALIHSLEKEYGVHYAMGGTGKLVEALVKLFEELGGTLRCQSDVVSIDTQGKRAKSVRLATGEVLDCDLVVSNADLFTTYEKLIDSKSKKFYSQSRLQNFNWSMSLVVIYFGVSKKFPDLKHHSIILTERYKELIGDIFNRKTLADDFSLYVHLPSVTDPSVAPEGHEAGYVLAPVPHLSEGGVNWEVVGPQFEDRVLRYLDQNLMPGLMQNLVVRHSINPNYFRDTLGSHLGNAFGIEPTLLQSAYFRPHNRSQDIHNLYLVGASTQPGAGMPGVLLSAQITDKLIARDFNLQEHLNS
ncbi:MAG: phytoene desaturase [Oligoflexia bacterium]|nr:phytoene desaturase [Oligoflexia bacterium]